MKLFLLMFIVTAIEVVLIAVVGSEIGFILTFLLIIITAMVGSWQLRKQGLSVIKKLQTMQTEPSTTMLEGLVLLICGVLLITPGFLTDIVGFLGLVPTLRLRLVTLLKKYSKTILTSKMQSGTMGQSAGFQFEHYSSAETQSRQVQDDSVIEGEFERKDGNLD